VYAALVSPLTVDAAESLVDEREDGSAVTDADGIEVRGRTGAEKRLRPRSTRPSTAERAALPAAFNFELSVCCRIILG